MMLLREVLLAALAQAGFIDAQFRFDAWFSGLDRGPAETALTSCSAHSIVRALLDELGHHPWQPLSEAAQTIGKAARFVRDRPADKEDELAGAAIAAACSLVARATGGAQSTLPFMGLALIGDLLRQDLMFAPPDRGSRVLSLAGRDVSIEQAAPRTPLWAIDARLGHLFAAGGLCRPALPFPGAITAESLGTHLWPNERGIIAVRALAACTLRLTKLVQASRSQVSVLRDQLGHLRSSSRAPQVWIVLAGFSPLGLDQLSTGFGVSRRGTYAVSDALIAAGVARRETIKGKVLLAAREPRPEPASITPEQSAPLPSSALTEFDAAMAEIDRLLQRNDEPN